jgi:hypothetical protein
MISPDDAASSAQPKQARIRIRRSKNSLETEQLVESDELQRFAHFASGGDHNLSEEHRRRKGSAS